MPQTLSFTSSLHSTGGDAPTGRYDASLEDPDEGLFALVSAKGMPAEAELAARSVREILRRSLMGQTVPLGERVLIAEEALESIAWVLREDAEAKRTSPVALAYVVALVADGWLAAVALGEATLHVVRSGSLYRLVGRDALTDEATTATKRVVRLLPGDRLLLSSAALARHLDEPTLAHEIRAFGEDWARRLVARHAGADPINAIEIGCI
ncbi:MAG: hypothetical protein P4L82_17385 [Ancalomicrobiaceae bacterium]|nr:hypothetical protein [Ancalomicrobiaceae bacterium]